MSPIKEGHIAEVQNNAIWKISRFDWVFLKERFP
jgi:hypothetical protein